MYATGYYGKDAEHWGYGLYNGVMNETNVQAVYSHIFATIESCIMTEVRNLREIIWLEKSQTLELLLEHEPAMQVIPLDSGLEAEVVKIVTPSADYVLKVWNKASKPDVLIQYQILNALYSHGRDVSEPLGWGRPV